MRAPASSPVAARWLAYLSRILLDFGASASARRCSGIGLRELLLVIEGHPQEAKRLHLIGLSLEFRLSAWRAPREVEIAAFKRVDTFIVNRGPLAANALAQHARRMQQSRLFTSAVYPLREIAGQRPKCNLVFSGCLASSSFKVSYLAVTSKVGQAVWPAVSGNWRQTEPSAPPLHP